MEANQKRSVEPDMWAPVPDIMEALRETAERMGDEVFATWVDAGDKINRHWTFRQTWEAAGAVAHALVTEWGVKPGDRVMLCYNFSYEYFPAFLGCLRAGAVACPVYPIDPSKMEIALNKFKHVVEDTGARLVLTDKLINRVRIGCSMFYSHLMPQTVEWKVTDHLVQPTYTSTFPAPSYDHPNRKPTDIAFLQYTSGSTGDPKGVMISYGNLGANVGLISGAQNFAFSYADLFPLTYEKHDEAWYKRPRSVSWLPMYHDMGLVYGVVTPFYMGARMHYMSPITFLKDPCSWIRLLAKEKATWAAGPDFAYRLCAKKWDASKWTTDDYTLTYMIYMHTGAEPIRPTTMEDFNRVFRPYHLHARALSPCYGLAESVVCVSWFDPVANPPETMISKGERPGYVCCAADWRVDLRIVDPETREEAEEGVAGELWVSGPSVALGYWNKPEWSEKAFRARLTKAAPAETRPWGRFGNGKYLRTGDMAFMQDGRIYYSGRLKDMMIVRGQNYYAQDIEFPAQDAWGAIRGGCLAAFSMDVEREEEEQLFIVFELAPGRYNTEVFRENMERVARMVKTKVGLDVYRMIAVKDRTIPKTTSGKIRRRATKEAMIMGRLWVLHDSLGLLPLGKGKGTATAAAAAAAAARASSSMSGMPTLERSVSSSYLAGVGESIGGILGSLYDALADPLGAYAGLDTDLIAGTLGRASSEGVVTMTTLTVVPREELREGGGEGGEGGGQRETIMMVGMGEGGGSAHDHKARPSEWSTYRGASGAGGALMSPVIRSLPPSSSSSSSLTSVTLQQQQQQQQQKPTLSSSLGCTSFNSSPSLTSFFSSAKAAATGLRKGQPQHQQHQSRSSSTLRDESTTHTSGRSSLIGPIPNLGLPSSAPAAVATAGASAGAGGEATLPPAFPLSPPSTSTSASALSPEQLCKLSWRQREAALVETIVEICGSVGLGKKEGNELSGETDMMSLGLSSIKAAELIGAIEARFWRGGMGEEMGGREGGLSEVIMFECATLQDVAQQINRRLFKGRKEGEREGVAALVQRGGSCIMGATGQVLAMGVTGALFTVSVLLPLQLCQLFLSSPAVAGVNYPWLLSALLLLPAAYLLFLFCLMASLTLTKWAVMQGRYQEGTYSTSSFYYMRWAFTNNLMSFARRNFVGVLKGTPIYTWWLQSMGLRLAAGAVGLHLPRLYSDDITEFDLVHIGAGAVVGEQARVRGAVVEGGYLHLRPVIIGDHAVIGSQSTLLPGAMLGKGAELAPASVLSGRSPELPPFTMWEGSPVKMVRPLPVPKEAAGAVAANRSWHRPLDSIMTNVLVPCLAVYSAGACLVLASFPAMILLGVLLLATSTGVGTGAVEAGRSSVTWSDLMALKDYSWALIIAPMVATFGPLTLPFFAVMTGLAGESLAAPLASTGVESTTSFLALARLAASEYYVVGVGVGVGLAYLLFGLALVMAAAVVQYVTGMLLILIFDNGIRSNSSNSNSSTIKTRARQWLVDYRELFQAVLYMRFPVFLGGSIGYNLYLLALGANVHLDAFVASEHVIKNPSALVIGAGAFIHPSALLHTSLAGGNTSNNSKIFIGQGALVGPSAVVGTLGTLEDASTLAPLTYLPAGKRVHTDTTKCGYATLLRLKQPAPFLGRITSILAKIGWATFTFNYSWMAVVLYIALVYVASYPSFVIVQLALDYTTSSSFSSITNGGVWLPGLLMAALFPLFGLCLLASAVLLKRLAHPGYLPSKHHALGGSFYYRHLFVTGYLKLIDRTFACLLYGSRLYNFYLSLLGLSVGRDSIIMTGNVLEGVDLLSIGDKTVINRDVHISAVKLNPSSTLRPSLLLEVASVRIGHECTLGDATVAMATSEMKDLGVSAGGTLMTPEIVCGRRVMVEGNLPYRVARGASEACVSEGSSSNLLTPSGPFNAPLELIIPDCDLNHECVFFQNLAAVAPASSSPQPIPSTASLLPPTVLVTGANGFVGRHVVIELLQRGLHVVCLVRRRGHTLATDSRSRMLASLQAAKLTLTAEQSLRLRVVDGDVSRPLLGLTRVLYEQLAEEVSVIFHSAAMLGFAAPYSNLRETNVLGTKRALEFAVCRRVKRFNHVSSLLATSLDMTNSMGRITEVSPLGNATVFPVLGASEWTHGYGMTKWAQEKLVLQAFEAGVLGTIGRLGEVGPHSLTGCMEEGILVDLVKETLEKGVVPMMLGRVNVTPVDYCARGLVRVGMEGWGLGRTYHLMDPNFDCGADTLVRLVEDLGYMNSDNSSSSSSTSSSNSSSSTSNSSASAARCDFLSWRAKMKKEGARRSWFVAGILSGEQQLVGQNVDATEGGAIISREEAGKDLGINGAILLRRFANYKGWKKEREMVDVRVVVSPS